MLRASIVGVAAVLALAAGPALAEEPTYFQQKAAEKIEELRENSGGALRGLLLYPKEVRDAILEVSVHPEMIVRLHDLGAGGDAKVDELTADYPAELKDFARLLVAEPQVLAILSENLILSGLVGAIYADDKPGIAARADAKAAEIEKLGNDAVSDWQQRISDDAEAQEQLEAATEAYRREVAADGGSTQVVTEDGDTINVNVNVDNAAGYVPSSSGSMVVYSVPSYSYSVYVLNHCDVYWAVCGHMHYHSVAYGAYYDDYWDDYWDRRDHDREDWQNHLSESREDRQAAGEERRGDIAERQQQRRDDLGAGAESGNGGLNQAMKDWKERNGDSLGDGFFKDDGKLNERFQDFGKTQREFGEGVRRGEYQRGDRTQVMQQGLSDAQRSRVSEARAGAPERARSGSRSERAESARSRAGSVERGQRSRSQKMERARSAHRGSWGSRSRGGGGQRRGGFGGGRRGGGRRR